MSTKGIFRSLLGMSAMIALVGAASGQEAITAPLQSETAVYYLDSGYVQNDGEELAVVFSQEFTIDGATWLRLKFDDVELAGSALADNESLLVITSLLDGATQYMKPIHVQQWKNTSAYFNGDTVVVEIWAHPQTGANRVVMSEVVAGLPGMPRSICDSTDDRLPSDDPRAGRLLPVGCTGWMIDDCNHCFLTAGHCTFSLDVVEFNVPLSDSSGNIQHPGPEDQYAVDDTSLQSSGSGGIGNDYAYFGVFPNSNTGLTPYEAMGDYFRLGFYIPPNDNRPITVTGYGSTSTSYGIPPEWYLIQKTHTGPYRGTEGTYALTYRPDTTGGNSGSPVIDETTGQAIGIHTHAGCTSSGGANRGTSITIPGLADYLNNPMGVCAGSTAGFSFPNGVPAVVSSLGGDTVTVDVGGTVTPVAGSGRFYVDAGTGFQELPMSDLGPGLFLATFPASVCNETVEFYFSVEGTDGETYYEPGGCNEPATGDYFAALSAVSIDEVASESFDSTDAGWTVGAPDDDATTGVWNRMDPDMTDAQPGDDHSPGAGGACWVTDGRGGTSIGTFDVDNGKTTLFSAMYDLSQTPNAKVSYWRWFSNDQGAAAQTDVFLVEINNGSGWTLVEQVGPTGPGTSGGWVLHEFNVSDIVAPTSTVQLRFVASDEGTGSIVEAAIDDFTILEVSCDATCPGDLTGDGVTDASDFATLVNCWGQPCADLTGDGTTDFDDFAILVNDWDCQP